MYKPTTPFNVAFVLMTPTYDNSYGVNHKAYSSPEAYGDCRYCSFKTYGGTERDVNGVYSIEDTGVVETWFDPEITSDCRICLLPGFDNIFEILGNPENIEMRNQYMRIKVRRIIGGA